MGRWLQGAKWPKSLSVAAEAAVSAEDHVNLVGCAVICQGHSGRTI